MKRIWILVLLSSVGLGACITFSQPSASPTLAAFVTSTLRPTRPGLSLPTAIPPTSTASTPETSPTATANESGTEIAASTGASSGGACIDRALMIADVTVPDNAPMSKGERFTKTWRFMNNGKCNWSAYTIAFVAGDRMAAPDSAPVPEAAPGETVDVAVELTAPSIDGSYTGFYELRTANGEPLSIGIERTFWVKILIGNVVAAPVATIALTPISGVPTVRVTAPAGCNHSTSSSYQTGLANLINGARAEAGLPPLTVNAALTAAAQGHSIDMACHGYIGHNGSDGSSLHDRVAAAGYSPARSSEVIYGSGYPQTAFDWWMNDQIHRNEILNPGVTEMGIGYAYVSTTAHGGYYTVVFASP